MNKDMFMKQSGSLAIIFNNKKYLIDRIYKIKELFEIKIYLSI